MTVAGASGDGQREIDIKKYAKIEKIPGGTIEDCRVLNGVMFNKDVVAPSRMRRKISKPRILLLDCPLEYKKGENQTNVEVTKEDDWCAAAQAGLPTAASTTASDSALSRICRAACIPSLRRQGCDGCFARAGRCS